MMRRVLFSSVILALGCAGEVGEPGEDGARGAKGDQGPPGPAGDAGPVGERGPSGAPGADGSDGSDGAKGAVGPAGEPGADGAPSETGYRPTLWFRCIRAYDLVVVGGAAGQDGIDETGLDYSATGFSNGDADTICTVTFGSTETASGGDYYPEPTAGAGPRLCIVPLDMPPNGGVGSSVGAWGFAVSPTQNAPAAAYTDDAGHPLRGVALPFAETDCVVKVADDDGTWTDGTLTNVVN
jgi:hypothetical protein